MSDTTKNLGQRINAVMRAVEYIKKVSEIDKKYKAVTHDEVTAALRKALVEHGIRVVPRIITSQTVPKPRDGWIRFEGVYEVHLVNTDNTEDREVYSTAAHADDNGDKAPGKALSYAVKAILLKAFSIETGETDESRNYDADVGELKQSMADAKTVDELRTRTGEALAALGKDHEDYKDVVAYGKALAAKLTAVKQPTEKAPPDDARARLPADAPPAEKPTAKGPPASKGLIQSIRNMGATKGLNDEDLLEALRGQGVDVERLEDLDKIQAATILASVTKMGAK